MAIIGKMSQNGSVFTNKYLTEAKQKGTGQNALSRMIPLSEKLQKDFSEQEWMKTPRGKPS